MRIFFTITSIFVLLFISVFTSYAGDSSLIVRPGALEGKPTTVDAAIWLTDIDSIDSSAQNFVANVYLMLQWKDPRLIHSGSGPKVFDVNHIWTPGMQIANEIGIVRRTFPEVVSVGPDGTVIYRQRFVGPFSQPLDLDDFPFDTQTFRLNFVSAASGLNDIEFVRNKKWIDAGLPKAGGIAKDISLPDWKIESFDTLPLPYAVAPGIEVAGYAFDFTARRDVRHYIWKVLLPLLFIVMMSWGVFWIDPSQAGTQIAVATTSMLTLIAYRFAIDSQVPRVPYMTKLDQFMVVGTILVFMCLVQVIVTSRLAYVGKVEIAKKIDKMSRIFFPIIFVIGLTIALVE